MIEQLTNRYRVLSTLGEGGMGVVFLVEDTSSNRHAALKVLSKIAGDGQEALLQFKQEFRTMTRLRHPNTVEVYDYGQLSDGTPFFTMEVVPGKGLDELLPLSADEFRPIVLQLVRALGYIHRQGLVHCDIKPENIRVTPEGQVKLMDFGLMVDAGTSGGTIRGTIAYMSPEVARRGKIDARADFYSLGALAYHLLTGAPPFPGEDPVSVLRAHLDLEPPPLRNLLPGIPEDLEDIVDRLLAKDPRARFQSAGELLAAMGDEAGEDATGVLLGSPMVGRQGELDALNQAMAGLGQGKGARLKLVGDLGSGKSRLLEEFRYAVQLAEIRILAGTAAEGCAPYGPFLAPLRDLAPMASLDVLGRHRGLLSRLLPELDDGGEVVRLEPIQEQFRLRAAIGELIADVVNAGRSSEAGGPKGGLVLMLDDWHWADELSRKLLDYLERTFEGLPVLFVVASRDEEADASGILRLSPLAEPDVAEMVRSMLGSGEVDDSFLATFAQLTGGNPLYIESSLRHLRERDLIASEQGRWVARTQLTARHLPSSIQDLVKERLGRLTETAAMLARAAAAIGRPSSLPLLARAAGLGEEALFEALEELRGAGILASENGTIAFLQGQVAEVLRDETPAELSADLHTRIAYALAEEQRDGLEATNELARHFLASHDRSRAVIAALDAAKRNFQLYALNEARTFFEEGFALLAPDSRMARMEYLYGLASLARFRDDQDLAIEKYKEALALAEEFAESEMEARILTSLGISHLIRQKYDAALDVLTRSEAVCRRTEDGRELIRCLQTMARVHYRRAEPLKAIERSEQVVAAAREAGGKLDDSGSLAFMGLMLVSSEVPGLDTPTRIRRGIAFLMQAIDKKRALGDKVGINDNLMLLGNAQWVCGDFPRARKTFEDNLAAAREVGARNDEIFCYLNLAIQSHELGDFKAVDAHASRGLKEAISTKSADLTIIAEILRSVALAHLGRPGEGQRLHAAAIAKLEELSAEVQSGIQLSILPYVAERQMFCGQVLGALASARASWDLIQETRMREYEQRTLTLLGEAYFRLGELESARTEYRKALEVGTQTGAVGTIARAVAGLAAIAFKEGDLVEAGRQAEEAHGRASEIGATYLTGEIALLRGRIALVQGDRALAERAFADAQRCGEDAASLHLRALALFGLGRAGNRSEAAVRLVRQAQNLLHDQIKSLPAADAEEYVSTEERWKLRVGDVTPEELPGHEVEAAGGSGRQRLAQLERKYLALLDERRQVGTELEEAASARERLERLLAFTAETNKETDLDRLLSGIMNLIGQMMGADRGFLLIAEPDREGHPFTVKSSYNIDVRDRREKTWQVSRSVADQVARTGEPVFLQDTLAGNEAFESSKSIQDLGVRTILCVPLRAAARTQRGSATQAVARVIGVIYLDRQSVTHAFQERDLVLVEALAAQATQAIENARLHSDASDKAAKLERLNELAKVVSTTLDLPKVLGMVADKTLEHTGSERCFVFLKDDSGRLECRLAKDASGADITDQGDQVSTTITRQVLEVGKSVVELDTRNSEVFQAQKSILDLELRTVMCVPFRMPRAESVTKRREIPPEADKRHRPEVEAREPRDEFQGVVYVDSKVVVNAFTDRDLQLLESIASLASSAIYNARLYERATVDALTGLYFRSFFERKLAEEAGRSRRTNSPLSVLMVDVDHFKKFNDTYGHATGDDVLRLVARTIKGNIREEDVAARFGGEEMLVLMPDTPVDGGGVLAERLREAIESAVHLGPGGDELHVTVSIGVAQLVEEDASQTLIERADAALYDAKHGGRNRVVIRTVG